MKLKLPFNNKTNDAPVSHKQHLAYAHAFAEVTAEQLTTGHWIKAAPLASFDHPVYGEVNITEDVVNVMLDNFRNKVYGQDIPITYEHFGMDSAKGRKAAGWVQDIAVRDDGMYWFVSFTEEAAKEIAADEWRYFSPEWYDVWQNPETGTLYTYVVNGGALTNTPFFKGMQPLNFSELVAAGLADNLPSDSSVDWEHSEPGEGTPREDDDETIDGEGTRGPSPDVEPEPEEYNMEEFLTKIRTQLGLTEDADEVAIETALSELVADVKPIRDAEDKLQQHVVFSEQYPAEWARLKALEQKDRESSARAFADRYATIRLVKGEGEQAEATPYGFSAQTVEQIEKLHLAFSMGDVASEHIEGVLDSLMNTGLVNYGEVGTATTPEIDTEDAPKAFSDFALSIAKEEKVSYQEAIGIAADRNPDLFQKYRNATKTQR